MKINLLALFVSFVLASNASAGIPVIDAGSIAQSTALVMEAGKQLKELQDQVKTAKNQLEDFRKEAEDTKKRLEGFTDYSNVFGSAETYLNDTLSEAKKDITNMDSLKSQHGIDAPSDTQLSKEYETKLKKIQRYETMEKNLVTQSKKLDKLQRNFSDAETPQQREEILNNLQLENMKMQNTLVAFDLAMKQEQASAEIEKQKAVQKWNKDFFSIPK
ncbi:hypothetical protein O8E94_003170 [Yersinia ruckeri]|nr:hypothetical protein [Yersinia ruckeri]